MAKLELIDRASGDWRLTFDDGRVLGFCVRGVYDALDYATDAIDYKYGDVTWEAVGDHYETVRKG